MSVNSLVKWLLGANTPSIRYLALRDLLDRPEADGEVRRARAAIMETGPVPAILAQQTADGHWAGERSYYTPKYVSTHWSMVLLVELAADPADARLQRGVDYMLSQTEARAPAFHAPEAQDIICFWANLLRYVVYCGRADDPRVAPILTLIGLASQVRQWGCRWNAQLPCAWGAARALWGLASLPPALRTPEIEAAIRSGIAFLCAPDYALVGGAYPTEGAIHKHWSRLNFPLFYQADVLFVLRAAAELGMLDQPGLQPALDWLEARQGRDGRWRGTSPYRAHTWRELGDREESARWVSLHAALVLKRAGRWRAM